MFLSYLQCPDVPLIFHPPPIGAVWDHVPEAGEGEGSAAFVATAGGGVLHDLVGVADTQLVVRLAKVVVLVPAAVGVLRPLVDGSVEQGDGKAQGLQRN